MLARNISRLASLKLIDFPFIPSSTSLEKNYNYVKFEFDVLAHFDNSKKRLTLF